MSARSGILPRLRRGARFVVERPLQEWKPVSRALIAALGTTVSCARKLRRDRAGQMAASLAYQTLFSLLPLLVLALLVLHSVRGLEDAGAQIRSLIVELVVPESLVDAGAEGTGAQNADAGVAGVTADDGTATVQEWNDARQVLARRIDAVIEALSQVSFAGLGAAGFLLLFYGAASLVRTIEASFNDLYQADPPRAWSRLPLYFTLLTLGPFAVVAAQVAQKRLLFAIGGIAGGWFATMVAGITPLVVTCALLAVAFRTIPNTWVSWRAAGAGGLVAGIAWFAFQEIFGFYVGRASMTSLYGALALVPLFLLWVYWSWLIILAGLALAFILQHVSADQGWARQHSLPGDPRWLVPIAARVARSFREGERLSTGRLGRELNLPPRILRPYVARLERKGYLLSMRSRTGEHLLTLARPPASISAQEILEIAPAPPTSTIGELVGPLHRAEIDAAAGLTLDDLASRLGEDASAESAEERPTDRSDRP